LDMCEPSRDVRFVPAAIITSLGVKTIPFRSISVIEFLSTSSRSARACSTLLGSMAVAASGVYKVTQLLPSESDDCQYRIKSSDEPHERVVKESELKRDL